MEILDILHFIFLNYYIYYSVPSNGDRDLKNTLVSILRIKMGSIDYD